MPGHIIIRTYTQLSAGAAAQRITLDSYPHDDHINWVRIMARVIAGDATLIIIGAQSSVTDYPMKAQKITNVGQSVNVTTAMYGSGDYKLYGEFTGTAAGEMLQLTAFGIQEHYE